MSGFFFEVKIFQNPFLLSFSFPLLNLDFLSSILLEFSKCLISQNIGSLIKTKKTAPKHVFKGVPHQQD